MKSGSAYLPVCGARKNHRAYAFPRFFRPRHSKPLHCTCHRQRAGASTQQATLVVLITRMAAAKHAAITIKNTTRLGGVFYGCGGRTRLHFLPMAENKGSPPSSRRRQRSPALHLHYSSPPRIRKNEAHPFGWTSLFLVAEAGLEPTTSGL